MSRFPAVEGDRLKREGKWQNLVTGQGLTKIKIRALRRRVWFKVLSRVERGIVDLTIRCVEKIRSPILTRVIFDIVRKVLKTLESKFLENVNKAGSAIAEKVCRIALGWGNVSASSWKHDSGFIRFLGVNAVNKSGDEGAVR